MDRFRDPGPGQTKHPVQQETIRNGKIRKMIEQPGEDVQSGSCRAVPKPQSLTGERMNLLEIAGHLTNPAQTGLKIQSLLYGHLEPRTNPSEMVNPQANAKCEMDRFRDPGPGQTKHAVQQETIRNGKIRKMIEQPGEDVQSGSCRAVPKPQSLTGERMNLLEIAGHLTNPAQTGLKIQSLLYGHLEPRTNPSEMVNPQANAKCEMDRFRDPGPGQTKHPVQQETIRNGKIRKMIEQPGEDVQSGSCRAVPKPQSLTGERMNLLEIAGHLTNPARTGLKIQSLLYGHLEPRTNPSADRADTESKTERFLKPGGGFRAIPHYF
ncbi:uncharacterized protein LOC119768098 [Culex quinquefasciatus]|uniref:uncharacterized protein LOC119768098 n=1 Tax=Culex quinquefasciatus TaxID=7176 RepID=UPI0018E299EF|nr:uncharacterized protein LOC119768098 [Culex quinquefasciatus]